MSNEINRTATESIFYFTKAEMAIKRNEYKNAIGYLDKFIELNPYDHKAYFNQGLSYMKLKDYKEAIINFSKSIEIDPSHFKYFYNRGECYNNLKQYKEALIDFTTALGFESNLNCYYWRGNIYQVLSDYESSHEDILDKLKKSIDDYTKVIELEPEIADVYEQRGGSYHNMNTKYGFENAIKDWKKAIELDPELESTLREWIVLAKNRLSDLLKA